MESANQFQERSKNGVSDGVQTAGQIIGIILLFLLVMAALRFFVNVIIDIVVLRNTSSLVRQLSQIRRWLCPWWHPRTENLEQHAEVVHSADNYHGTYPERPRTDVTMEHMLEGLTAKERYLLLASLLESETARDDDIDSAKDHITMSFAELSETELDLPSKGHDEELGRKEMMQPTISTCPVCIQEIAVGDEIILTKCRHLFHGECLVQWLSTHTRDCPCCRTQLLTEEIMREALLNQEKLK